MGVTIRLNKPIIFYLYYLFILLIKFIKSDANT